MENFTKSVFAVSFLCMAGVAHSQTPSDAMMMKQRESCLAVTYEHGSFNEYWEGETLRANATIEDVSRTAIAPMIAIGLHDRVNFYIAAPYIKTESSEPNGGYLNGAKGFQDLTLALKVELLNMELGKGKFAVLASGGYSTPITNYLSDYRPYSLGNGTNEWSARGIVQYKFDMGLYVRATGGEVV